MTTTRYIFFIVLVTSAILLSGCKLSASTPPAVTETPDSAMSTLEAELGNIATQTSVAGGEVESVPTQPPSEEGTTTTETAPETAPEATAEPETGTETEATQPPPTQPPSTPVPVATATPGVPETHTLQKGEFPFCIARRYNVNQTELLNLNGLSSSSILPIGYQLKIPQTGNKFTGQRSLIAHPANYTVAAGDTIYTIACEFGSVEPLAIAQANGLESPYTLSSGQVLNIP